MGRGSRGRKRMHSPDQCPSPLKSSKLSEAAHTLEHEIGTSSAFTKENSHDDSSTRGKEPSASWRTSPLCSFCNAIFEHWEQFLRDPKLQLPHYGYMTDLEASAANGCSLCVQFMYGCQSKDGAYYKQASKLGCSPELIVGPGSNLLPLIKNPKVGIAWFPISDFMPTEKSYLLEIVLSSKKYPNRRYYKSWISMVPARDEHSMDFDFQLGNKSSLSTQESLQLCKQWLIACQNCHTRCNLSSSSFMPTRLVCVRGSPRVVSTSEWSDAQRFATLSHCWGSCSFLTLTKSNIWEFEESIPAKALSKTFLDAIFVCQQLDVDYIWIDSLCIIQDDVEDWEREAALMTKVYGSSYVNIAASGAEDGSVGLFFRRSTAWQCRVKVPVSGTGMHYNCIPFRMHEESIQHMPLYRRGWAVQERLLPSRTILFTATQIFWECYENTACEIFPKSYPKEIPHESDDDHDTSQRIFRKEHVQDIPWDEIIRQYTRCNLTFNRDRLVAISGLAREIQCQSSNQYCAGLWRDDIEAQLLWLIDEDKSIISLKPNKRAPTWSWASVDGPVLMPPVLNPVFCAKYLDLHTPPGEDLFGPISTAQISLSCLNLWRQAIGELGGSQDEGSSWYHRFAYTERGVRSIEVKFSCTIGVDWTSIFFLPVLFTYNQTVSSRKATLHGLTLQSTRNTKGYFSRIGTFRRHYGVEPRGDQIEDIEKSIHEHWKTKVEEDMYVRVYVDENGETRKVIILV
ncbi:heterokaryon incompatibility protein-domain-containing protein [Tricladium varicosporioides]|nr:heterokaryon incompatibility protein-domain-containing protein [Hymenoscyphus varicosporioides]